MGSAIAQTTVRISCAQLSRVGSLAYLASKHDIRGAIVLGRSAPSANFATRSSLRLPVCCRDRRRQHSSVHTSFTDTSSTPRRELLRHLAVCARGRWAAPRLTDSLMRGRWAAPRLTDSLDARPLGCAQTDRLELAACQTRNRNASGSARVRFRRIAQRAGKAAPTRKATPATRGVHARGEMPHAQVAK